MAANPPIPVLPFFTLTASPSVVSVLQGASATCVITVRIADISFNSAIALSASGLPAGVTASFSPTSIAAPGSGSSTLTLTASSSAANQNSSITITAAGGGLTKSTSVLVTPAGFILTANPTSGAVVQQGGTVNSAISSAIGSGFNSAIALSVSGLPAGATATFSASSIAAPGSGTSTLTLTSTDALRGIYVITVSGSGGRDSASIQFTLEVSTAAKVVSLRVRAAQVANLCFAVDGILGEMDVQLGATVNSFDFATFYGNLGTVASTPNDNSLLQFNSANIYTSVSGYRLAALRAEPVKATLDSAILSRQNAFYKKYIDISGISTQMQAYSNVAVSGNVTSNLQTLAAQNNNQWGQLSAVYNAETPPRTGVVKTTSSELQASDPPPGPGTVTTTTTIATDLTTTQLANPYPNTTGVSLVPASNSYGYSDQYTLDPTLPPGSGNTPFLVSQTFTFPPPTKTANTLNSLPSANQTQSVTTTTGQTTLNTDYGYRVPYVEGFAQFLRASISLTNQQYNQYLFGVQVPNVTTILTNELALLDLGVKRLQVAYLDTMLMSPISGQITGLFKNVGDRVKAGEPVLRVEGTNPNNGMSFVLVGTLSCSEPITVGASVTVTTTMWGNSGVATPNPYLITFSGNVLAARGHGEQENLWNVVVAFYNVPTPPPPNYTFDIDDTSVSIAPAIAFTPKI
jgi:hypothetical protein